MKPKNPLSLPKIAFYLTITILIALFFVKNTIDFSVLKSLVLTPRIILGITAALAMLLLRDLGYILRLRLMCDHKISFRQSLKIILFWEFGSAITPGMIGGKAVAIYLLLKHKINMAKASSIVLLAILADEMIFICLFPLFYLKFHHQMISPSTDCSDWISLASKVSFLHNISYIESVIFAMLGFMFIFVSIAFLGIFWFPQWTHHFLKKIAQWNLLHRWQRTILDFSDELYQTNLYLKRKKMSFWIQLIGFTAMSWVGRYMVGVAIVWGFCVVDFDFWLIYAKQYALWLMFYLPTTPGSSGLAETLYMAYYCPYFPDGLSGTVAFIWRWVSYYIYIILGSILFFYGMSNKRK